MIYYYDHFFGTFSNIGYYLASPKDEKDKTYMRKSQKNGRNDLFIIEHNRDIRYFSMALFSIVKFSIVKT